MKKFVSLILTFVFCSSLSACGSDDNKDKSVGFAMKIIIGGNEFIANLYDNETASRILEMLPLTVKMSEHGGVEKYFNFSSSLPINASNPGTIQAGDIMLYGNNCLVLFYKTHSTSFSYTKIGKIESIVSLSEALGSGSVTVTFSAVEN